MRGSYLNGRCQRGHVPSANVSLGNPRRSVVNVSRRGCSAIILPDVFDRGSPNGLSLQSCIEDLMFRIENVLVLSDRQRYQRFLATLTSSGSEIQV